jgi:cytoskeletal protein RodZ
VTQAGWYPDPAGQPQTYRYWDGSAWSQETTSDPYAPAPFSSAPPPPPPPPPSRPAPPAGPPSPPSAPPATVVVGGAPAAPYGQPGGGYGAVPPGSGQPPGFGGFPPVPPSGGSSRSGLTILLVIVAVLALVGLSVGGFFGYRALTDDDDSGTEASDRSSATDETSGPTETSPTEQTSPTDATTPTESTTSGTTTTDQQCHGGVPTPTVTPRRNADQVKGGTLSIPVPDGYQPELRISPAFAWADSFTPVYRTIEESSTSDSQWLSVFGVGGLRKSNGFEDPAQAAEVVMACMVASPDQYTNVTGREDLSSGEITIDGTAAYQLTSEIRVDNPELEAEGDIAQVIVVDMGDPEMFGLYISQATIGDPASTSLQEQMVDRILVD